MRAWAKINIVLLFIGLLLLLILAIWQEEFTYFVLSLLGVVAGQLLYIATYYIKSGRHTLPLHINVLDIEDGAQSKTRMSIWFKIFSIILSLLFLFIAVMFVIAYLNTKRHPDILLYLGNDPDALLEIFYSVSVFTVLLGVSVAGFNILSAFRKIRIISIPEIV